MNTGIIIFILLGVLIVLGLGAWLFYIIWKKSEHKEGNLIINFMPQHTTPIKGFALGTEINTIKSGERQLLKMKPKDIREDTLKELEDKDVDLVVDRNKMDILPAGDWSSYRNIKIIWPPRPEDLPVGIKQSRFGKMLMKYVEELSVDSTEIDIVREGSIRKTKLLKKMGDGEVSEEFIERSDGLQKDLLKNVNDKSTPKTTITPTTSMHTEVR